MIDNPDYALGQGPKPRFASRYADPGHAASSGSVLGSVGCGKITGEQIRTARLGGRLRGSSLDSVQDRRQPTMALGPLERSKYARASHPISQEGVRNCKVDLPTVLRIPVVFLSAVRCFGCRGRLGLWELDKSARFRASTAKSEMPAYHASTYLNGGVMLMRFENILYVMIINMPVEEEMEEA
ncbi:hypothetical protein BP00DRAFT_425165 [Aspergillus indologenus CBS 114.80]|uniref:Uncharacterized protein n=1 Tax=Aspergillus indologenus CBS 114.80 TaxID=1450541 RepID=A0A2V5J3W2_9EURO|nr:hypothetical protein BP00DRAFT_425165 [Aspergillus indologenus CBS 114.80]